jgi:nitrile hydratase accessory protein
MTAPFDPHAVARFDQPWHAQVFSLTVALNEAGHFAWTDWAEAFGATLARHGAARDLDGGEDYFAAWLETLEAMLARLGLADAAQIGAMRDQWEAAYLSTPHGQPVHLAE